LSLLICRKIAVLCAITLSRQGIKPVGKHLISSANDSSVPGRTQAATFVSSDAANPRVPVPKLCVVSLSPTFAGRDLTLWRLFKGTSGAQNRDKAPGLLRRSCLSADVSLYQ
jgi:hypothetical protein